MTLVRFVSLVGVGLLVMLANVAMSIVYMVVYGHLINPGHPKEFYDEHVKIAAPYCSIITGIPLMFLAGIWVAGWAGAGGGGLLGVKAAIIVWLTYAIIDLGILLAMGGMNPKISMLLVGSLVTKLAAAYAGARFRLS